MMKLKYWKRKLYSLHVVFITFRNWTKMKHNLQINMIVAMCEGGGIGRLGFDGSDNSLPAPTFLCDLFLVTPINTCRKIY